MVRFIFKDNIIFQSELGNVRFIPEVGDYICANWTKDVELRVATRIFYYDDENPRLVFELEEA